MHRLQSVAFNALFLVLLAVGGLLIVFSIHASRAIRTDLIGWLPGAAADQAIWLLVAGVMAATVGVGGLMRPPRQL